MKSPYLLAFALVAATFALMLPAKPAHAAAVAVPKTAIAGHVDVNTNLIQVRRRCGWRPVRLCDVRRRCNWRYGRRVCRVVRDCRTVRRYYCWHGGRWR